MRKLWQNIFGVAMFTYDQLFHIHGCIIEEENVISIQEMNIQLLYPTLVYI